MYKLAVVGGRDFTELIAFWDGKSKDTKHIINIAEKEGKLLKVVRYD